VICLKNALEGHGPVWLSRSDKNSTGLLNVELSQGGKSAGLLKVKLRVGAKTSYVGMEFGGMR